MNMEANKIDIILSGIFFFFIILKGSDAGLLIGGFLSLSLLGKNITFMGVLLILGSPHGWC